MCNESMSKATNCWEHYQLEFAPKLKNIDIEMKCMERPLSVAKTARLLDLSVEEVSEIMQSEDIISIRQSEFFRIMSRGKNDLCALYQREVECRSPYAYTIEHISYIYNIEIELLRTTCQNLRIKELTAFTIPLVLSNVPYRRCKGEHIE